MLEEINRYKYTPPRRFNEDGKELVQLKDETWITFEQLVQKIALDLDEEVGPVKTWYQKLWDLIRRVVG